MKKHLTHSLYDEKQKLKSEKFINRNYKLNHNGRETWLETRDT